MRDKDTGEQVREQVCFFLFKPRSVPKVNYQATYRNFIDYMLEMEMDMGLDQT